MVILSRLLLTWHVGWVQEYAAATAEAEMAEAKAVRQGEEAEAFKRIADEKRLLAYQLADRWTGTPAVLLLVLALCIVHVPNSKERR